MTTADISNPILNSPYDPPEAHFEIGPKGPTGKVLDGRRPSESFIPIPPSRKGRDAEQQALDFDVTGERREQNTLINDIRREVERWRASNWNGVTPYTRKLLAHWAAQPPARDDPVLFCQREAAETAIFLAEVAGRHGTADYRRRLEPENRLAQRRAATRRPEDGDRHRQDGRHGDADRLADDQQGDDAEGRALRQAVPRRHPGHHDPRPARRPAPGARRQLLPRARPRARRPVGRAAPGADRDHQLPRVPAAGRQGDPGRRGQHPQAAARRQARDGRRVPGDPGHGRRPDPARASGPDKGEIVVLNDEAHHCYQDKLLGRRRREADKEDEERNREARVWFRGLCDLRRKAGIKTVYDLSATPYYLKGSGYNEGFIFPWVVSDFSLMDAIESGIVKIPRIPVDDDAAGKELVYLQLVGPHPAAAAQDAAPKDLDAGPQGWVMPEMLEGALAQPLPQLRAELRPLRGRARGARRAAAGLHRGLPQHGRLQARLRLDRRPRGRTARRNEALGSPATCRCSATSMDGAWTTRQRTILVDSAQLESGEPLGADSARTRRERSKRSSRPTGSAIPAPTSTSSPTPTCCARR